MKVLLSPSEVIFFILVSSAEDDSLAGDRGIYEEVSRSSCSSTTEMSIRITTNCMKGNAYRILTILLGGRSVFVRSEKGVGVYHNFILG